MNKAVFCPTCPTSVKRLGATKTHQRRGLQVNAQPAQPFLREARTRTRAHARYRLGTLGIIKKQPVIKSLSMPNLDSAGRAG